MHPNKTLITKKFVNVKNTDQGLYARFSMY